MADRQPRVHTVGEGALMVELGDTVDEQTSSRVQAATALIEQTLGEALIDLVPAYTSVLVLYDPLQHNHTAMARTVRTALAGLSASSSKGGESIVLPVYYSEESGADLRSLADRARLSVDEVIALHTATEYRVYAIGFAPGFAYLGQVDERIAASRLSTPRVRVPAGSVAIADRQTAVYPAASPGGWNLVGCCPLPMFNPDQSPHMPVVVGDRVRFEAIGREEFLSLGGSLEPVTS